MSCYIDPGAGSLALQILIGFGLVALYSLKRYWRRLVAWWRDVAGRVRRR